MTGRVFYVSEYKRVTLHTLALNGLRVWLRHFDKLSDQKGHGSVTQKRSRSVSTFILVAEPAEATGERDHLNTVQ